MTGTDLASVSKALSPPGDFSARNQSSQKAISQKRTTKVAWIPLGNQVWQTVVVQVRPFPFAPTDFFQLFAFLIITRINNLKLTKRLGKRTSNGTLEWNSRTISVVCFALCEFRIMTQSDVTYSHVTRDKQVDLCVLQPVAKSFGLLDALLWQILVNATALQSSTGIRGCFAVTNKV